METREKSLANLFLVLMFAFGFSVAGTGFILILRAWGLTILWGWFLEPFLNMSPSFAQAVGMVLIAYVLTASFSGGFGQYNNPTSLTELVTDISRLVLGNVINLFILLWLGGALRFSAI